jgi:hypothetical protein
MAKVVGPLHSSEARGSVGALTYNTWRGLSTVKLRQVPSTEFSDKQKQIRALTKLCTISWQSIGDTLRAAWNTYANQHPDLDWTGSHKHLSGYNIYVRLNVRALHMGESIATSPPAQPFIYTFSGVSFYLVSTYMYARWTTPGYPPTGLTRVQAFRTHVHSPAANPSFKMAFFDSYAEDEDEVVGFTSEGSGTFSLFIRAVHSSGLVSPIARGILTVP